MKLQTNCISAVLQSGRPNIGDLEDVPHVKNVLQTFSINEESKSGVDDLNSTLFRAQFDMTF